ncbi:DUF6210 family protein [Flavobacterium pedocola]
MKPKVKLHDAIGLGLIINYPTGITFTNQTGGTACYQSSCEGLYLPIGNDITVDENRLVSPSIALEKYFTNAKHSGHGATDGLDRDDYDEINKTLKAYHLSDSIAIDEESLAKSHEAWIYVKIKNLDLIDDFPENLDGILTWSNSD